MRNPMLNGVGSSKPVPVRTAQEESETDRIHPVGTVVRTATGDIAVKNGTTVSSSSSSGGAVSSNGVEPAAAASYGSTSATGAAAVTVSGSGNNSGVDLVQLTAAASSGSLASTASVVSDGETELDYIPG